MKKAVKRLVSKIVSRLVRVGVLRNTVIIRMDGGICSQMHFYIVGKILERKGNRVAYDLSWYEESGMDLDGVHCRNYDLERLFPGLQVDKIPKGLTRRLYITSFYHHNNWFGPQETATAWQELRQPVYLAGYFKDSEEMFGELFDQTFRIDESILAGRDKELLEEIKTKGADSCAIHARRGDLAKYNPAYGEPVSAEYFTEAIREMQRRSARPVTFFLFSDDPGWARENIVARNPDADIRVCGENGSDKGYVDLLLLSRCHHVIASHGSMGKYGARLRQPENRDGIVILPNSPLTP